jgi:hypothetical protein
MLKIYLKLKAKKDLPFCYKKDQEIEFINDIFNKQNGIAYFSLSKDWEIIEMKLIEFTAI